MKKRFAQIAGIVLAVVLVGGVILTRPREVNEDILTAKVDVFEEETDSSEVVIDDEEVPLASAPKVKTTTSSKTTTKKQKMKAASKKSKTTTKTKTRKSKKTVNSSSKSVIKETTVKTTTRTTVKKNSKIKTIRTTVKTTIKTTTKSLGGSVTSGSGSSGQGTSLRQLASKADSSVLNAFETLGFELRYNTNAPYSGAFNPTGGYIELKKADGDYLLHELGHFVSFLVDGADSTSEFKEIFQSEKSKYTASNKAYVLTDSAEYFAESYKNYKENPSKLRSERPQTYEYIASCVKKITPSLVSEIKGIYGYLWK